MARYLLVLLCLLCAGAAFASGKHCTTIRNADPRPVAPPQPPSALMMGTTPVVSARVVADWMVALITFDLQKNTVTISQDGGVTFTAHLNHKTATTNDQPVDMPAPAFRMNGATYIPAATLAEAFGMQSIWNAKAHTVTLTRPEAKPLVMKVAGVPRSVAVSTDTLAGFTPGDHIALAVERWGEPIAVIASPIPDLTDYYFRPDPQQGGVGLIFTARENAIVMIYVYLTGNATPEALKDLLPHVGTAHGLLLAGKVPAYYGKAHNDYTTDTPNVTLRNYEIGKLNVITAQTNAFGANIITEISMAWKPFKSDWLQVNGPLKTADTTAPAL